MPNVWYLVIAGGGGSGRTQSGHGGSGAGGAGGYRTNAAYDYAVSVGSYTVTVGDGGLGATVNQTKGANGADSVFDTITATGGGGGGAGIGANGDGANGGSGGGGGQSSTAGGAPVAGQGSAGGDSDATNRNNGAGGGGAGGAGGDVPSSSFSGNGGVGLDSAITGATVRRAGGGSGGAWSGTTGTVEGGGGAGFQGVSGVGTAGSANTGGGAGGSTGANDGAKGGSGVVIIRYATADLAATGGTITTDGAYTIHTFTASGTFEVTAIPPVAAFSGTPLTGEAPLTVQFTDASTNTPTSWAWTFGDAGTSTSQNPSHTYNAAGIYTVGLTATNAAGSDLETKTDYITVTSSADTHDGMSYEEHEEIKRKIEARSEEYKASRARLKEQLRFALEGPADEEIAEELAEVSVEKPDYRLPAHELVDMDKLMARIELRLRIEEMARRRAQEEDERDVERLLLH